MRGHSLHISSPHRSDVGRSCLLRAALSGIGRRAMLCHFGPRSQVCVFSFAGGFELTRRPESYFALRHALEDCHTDDMRIVPDPAVSSHYLHGTYSDTHPRLTSVVPFVLEDEDHPPQSGVHYIQQRADCFVSLMGNGLQRRDVEEISGNVVLSCESSLR